VYPLTRSTSRSRFFGLPFSPSVLFAAGEQGVWYDPSDFSTLFQNAAGTTPVTAVEQPVRLMLDKSGRGNHALAPNDSARPVLRARYNLLTRTEEFNDAAWTKTAVTATANATTAPDGTTTADSIIEDSTNSQHAVFQTVTTAAGSATFSVYAKLASGSRFLSVYPQGTTVGYAIFNLSTGVITQTGGGAYLASSINSVGNGWYRCSVTWTASATSTVCVLYLSDSATTPAPGYTGDGTSGVFIWGADLRVTNDALNQPSYQRVGAASDYDTNGFLPYLAFDGSDDAMSTAAINFGSTDEMTVFAGVRALANATGIIAEFSADAGANNGSFVIARLNTGTYEYGMRGTSANAVVTSVFSAPDTATLIGRSKIATPIRAIRRNNGTESVLTASAGTGNMGNHPLFIGARNNGASLFFNGRLYSLTVVGRAVNSGELAAMEAYVNQKTAAY